MGSSYLNAASCSKDYQYVFPHRRTHPPQRVDDSREQADITQMRKGMIDDAESVRMADDDFADFPLSSYLFPMFPFAYLCEHETNDTIFRTKRKTTYPTSSCTATSCVMPTNNNADELEVEDATLCRCHAWSQDSPNSGMRMPSSVSQGKVKETLALADEADLESSTTNTTCGNQSGVRVLNWEEEVRDSSDIRLERENPIHGCDI